jgi:hypothetical protein
MSGTGIKRGRLRKDPSELSQNCNTKRARLWREMRTGNDLSLAKACKNNCWAWNVAREAAMRGDNYMKAAMPEEKKAVLQVAEDKIMVSRFI